MIMRFLTASLTVLAMTLSSSAAAKEAIPAPDAHQSVNQYLAYPYRTAEPPAQTPAPKGLKPFHMEHYGRHGSRWLNQAIEYSFPVEQLAKAAAYGKLTPLGQKVLALVDSINRASAGRIGDLTEVGALDHQAIARRMARNYPEIFAPGTHVDAKSSIVVRCIISMLNELQELKAAQPDLVVTSDASMAEMPYMVPAYTPDHARLIEESRSTGALAQFRNNHRNNGAYISKLFNDPKFAADSLDTQTLASRLIAVLGATQNHLHQPWMLEEVFTPEELHQEWLCNNSFWFNELGKTPITKNQGPMQRESTLRNFIESADTAMTSRRISANLRFGHDGIVLPLALLMELNGTGGSFDSLEELEGRFHDYTIIPMGANIQWIFYRPAKGAPSPDNVVVKVLLNENEATLPIQPSRYGAPYYNWTDMRRFLLDKINNQN